MEPSLSVTRLLATAGPPLAVSTPLVGRSNASLPCDRDKSTEASPSTQQSRNSRRPLDKHRYLPTPQTLAIAPAQKRKQRDALRAATHTFDFLSCRTFVNAFDLFSQESQNDETKNRNQTRKSSPKKRRKVAKDFLLVCK